MQTNKLISHVKEIVGLSIVLVLFATVLLSIIIYNYYQAQKNSEQNLAFCGVESPQEAQLSQNEKNGKLFFINNCASCHSLSNTTLIGPGLGGIGKRRSLKWIIKMVKNPAYFVSQDKEAAKLYQKYKPIVMTSYPNMSEDDVKNIVAYCNLHE